MEETVEVLVVLVVLVVAAAGVVQSLTILMLELLANRWFETNCVRKIDH